MFSLCHPWFTTTNLSYTFPILETSATASCGSTGIIYFLKVCVCVNFDVHCIFLGNGDCWCSVGSHVFSNEAYFTYQSYEIKYVVYGWYFFEHVRFLGFETTTKVWPCFCEVRILKLFVFIKVAWKPWAHQGLGSFKTMQPCGSHAFAGPKNMHFL